MFSSDGNVTIRWLRQSRKFHRFVCREDQCGKLTDVESVEPTRLFDSLGKRLSNSYRLTRRTRTGGGIGELYTSISSNDLIDFLSFVCLFLIDNQQGNTLFFFFLMKLRRVIIR